MAKPTFRVWLIAASLVLVTLAVYWPTTQCDFVNYDDQLYVTSNAHTQNGLTWESIKWACLNPVSCNWHPVTMWSHMLDCQLFGLKPWGHHLTSVLLHALNASLVFILLQMMTGATWRSLAVAALFGLHPLHVESVAWVSERKDVLSGFFGLLALIAYARYAQSRMQKLEGSVRTASLGSAFDVGCWMFDVRVPSSIFYLLSLFFFALGLMSKPMLVTWPFVMLLLDYWPLRRFEPSTINSRRSTIQRLVVEKLPFFALSAISSVVTFIVQQHGGAMTEAEHLPLGARSGNALISYGRYLGKLFWPTDLAVYYPHPGHWPLGHVMLAGGVILALTVLVWVTRRRHPYMLVGWLWFVGTLVPVIGLVQVGEQAMADRYTYLPSLGVLILAVWGIYELVQGKAEGRSSKDERTTMKEQPGARLHNSSFILQPSPLWVAGGAVIVLCLTLTRQQVGYWKDSEALFRHALAVTENNALAHNSLGVALRAKGRMDEAFRQFQEALRLKPDYVMAHINLGVAFDDKSQPDEAIGQYKEALRLKPDDTDAAYNLGNTLFINGQTDEAIRQFQEALRLEPGLVQAHISLGNAFGKQGRTNEAIRQFQEALRLKPDYALAHFSLGKALGIKGQTDDAIAEYREALRLKPDDALAHNNLGAALVKKGQIDEAIGQYREALRLKPDYAEASFNLGNALLTKGQIDEAIHQFQEALRLRPDYAEARNNLAYLATHYPNTLAAMAGTLAGQGNYAEAIRCYQAALKAQPDQEGVLNNLAWLLASCPNPAFRNGSEAVRLATRACKLTDYGKPLLIGTLAAAQAEAGDFQAAIATAERAAAQADTSHLEQVAARNRELLQLYRQGQPFHEKR